MAQMGITSDSNRTIWFTHLKARARVLEDIGRPDAALALMKADDTHCFKPSEIERLERLVNKN